MNRVNISADSRTKKIGDVATSSYAPIMKARTTISNINNSNKASIIFRLYHGVNTSMIVKEYAMYINRDTYNTSLYYRLLKDLTPNVKGIDAVLGVNGEEVTLYVKGSIPYADIQLQALHCECLPYFEMVQLNAFTVLEASITDKIYPINQDFKSLVNFTYANNWVDYATTNKTVIYKEGNNVNVSFDVKSGLTDGNVVVLTLEDNRPTKDIFFVAVTYNGTTFSVLPCILNTSGELKTISSSTNVRVTGNISYNI